MKHPIFLAQSVLLTAILQTALTASLDAVPPWDEKKKTLEPQDVDRLFVGDLYPPTMPLGESLCPWQVNDALLAEAQTDGVMQVDAETTLNGQPTLRLQAAEGQTACGATWVKPVEEGRTYRFAAVARRAPPAEPKEGQPFGGCRLRLTWRDEAGKLILTRDRLEARTSNETAWMQVEAVGLTPSGARQAALAIEGVCQPGESFALGDFRWGPVQMAPVEVTLFPRVLLSRAEPLTIRIARSHVSSVTADGTMRIELVGADGKVHRQWREKRLVTLPWTRTIQLPKDAPTDEQFWVRVAIEPVKPYPGAQGWQWREPVFAGSRAEGPARLKDERFVFQGRKRFLIGAYHAQPEDYAVLKAAGFNAILAKAGPVAEATQKLDALHAAGMAGLFDPGNRFRGHQARTRELAAAIGSHPALAAWVLCDEPTRHGVGPRECAWACEWLKSLTPEIPVFLNDTGPYQFHRFISTVDVFSADPYPVATKSKEEITADPPLDMVTRWMTLIRNAKPSGRAFVGVIGSYAGENTRAPTDLELKNMAWQVVAGGAAGLKYYSIRDPDWYLPKEPLFKTVAEINRDLQALEPWLITRPLASDEAPIQAQADLPDALVAATWESEGRYLLLLVNLERTERKVSFRKSGPAEDAKCMLDNGRAFPRRVTLKPLETVWHRFKVD